MSVLLVSAGGRLLALPADQVQAVLEAPETVALPAMQPQVLHGMATYGGAPLPVIDLARLCGLGPGAPGGPVAVLRGDGHPVGCRVDSVGAFTERPPDAAERFDAGSLALWQLLAHGKSSPRAVMRPTQGAAEAAPRPAAVADTLNVRLGGRDAFLPIDQVEKLLDREQAVVLPRPVLSPPTPPVVAFVLLHGREAIPMLDLGSEPGAGTALILARVGQRRFAFAVDGVRGLGAPSGVLLDLHPFAKALPIAIAAPEETQLAHETPGFLEVVLGERACLLPLGQVARVLPAEGREALPGLRFGALRAVAGQVLPGLDARPLLGLPGHAVLAHDIVLQGEMGAFFLSVEQVRGLVQLDAAAVHELIADETGLVGAVARSAGVRLWVLDPSRLFAVLRPADAA